tara:strand:+ start:149 stop:298 length:150 start_codon:yes stop_codon:yes gene_type:complete
MDIAMIARAVASVAVCALGAYSMYLTTTSPEPTGIGWAVLGLFLIWGST